MLERLHYDRHAVALITSQAHSLSNFRGPLIGQMIARGRTVYALAPDHDNNSREKLAEIGAIAVDFSMSRTGMNPVRDFADVVQLVLLLKKLSPEIILSYAMKPVIYGTIAAFLVGIPRRFALVAGLGHAFAQSSSFKQRVGRLITKGLLTLAFKLCEGVIFQNEDDRDEFVSRGHLNKAKTMRTNGTGVDLEKFPHLPFPSGPITFLMAARLIRPKGVIEFAEAAKLIKAISPSTHFILLGGLDSNPEGLTQCEVEQLVRSADLEWAGHVDDVTPYFRRSHVFVLPSYYREGVPRAAQEALAFGRAIITTDNVGCRETVTEDTGIIVPIKDVQALVFAMKQILNDTERLVHYGKYSRIYAEKKFNVNEINAKILQFMNI